MKEMLVHEFGCDIGFHVSQRKNLSEVVYDAGSIIHYWVLTMIS